MYVRMYVAVYAYVLHTYDTQSWESYFYITYYSLLLQKVMHYSYILLKLKSNLIILHIKLLLPKIW